MAMTKVSEVTVGSGGAASITFSNIPQTGKDLLVVASLRNTSTANAAKIEFNSSSANLSDLILQGDGSAATSATNATRIASFAANRSDSTSSTFANSQTYISNYTSSAKKSVSGDGVTENNATLSYQRLTAGLWDDTSAITSVQIVSFSTFAEYSTASLYIVS